jgi:hypothetical protein
MAVRELARLPALAASAALLLSSSMAAGGQEPDWPQAEGRLGREKTLAEACASILKTFADDAPMARVQGERIYARAEADMDGLVRLFIVDLASQRSLADVPELQHRLEAVVAQRQTLCRHVDAAVGTALRDQPEHSGATDLLEEGIADPVGFLMDAAVQVWQAYRDADQVERATIIAGIEAIRWLPFAEVPPA